MSKTQTPLSKKGKATYKANIAKAFTGEITGSYSCAVFVYTNVGIESHIAVPQPHPEFHTATKVTLVAEAK